LQPLAISGKSTERGNGGNTPKPLPWVATGCMRRFMVRRGSPVRVRKRALQKPRTAGFFFRVHLHDPQRAIGMEPFVEPSGREVSLPAAKNGHIAARREVPPPDTGARDRRSVRPEVAGSSPVAPVSEAPRKIACLRRRLLSSVAPIETILETVAFAQSESDLPYAYVPRIRDRHKQRFIGSDGRRHLVVIPTECRSSPRNTLMLGPRRRFEG